MRPFFRAFPEAGQCRPTQKGETESPGTCQEQTLETGPHATVRLLFFPIHQARPGTVHAIFFGYVNRHRKGKAMHPTLHHQSAGSHRSHDPHSSMAPANHTTALSVCLSAHHMAFTNHGVSNHVITLATCPHLSHSHH